MESSSSRKIDLKREQASSYPLSSSPALHELTRPAASGLVPLRADSPRKEEPLGRRERERLFRRREILLVAKRLFASQGFAGTTLDEVARLTEFSKPTLYQYFRNKEHLYHTILEEGLIDLAGIMDKEFRAERSMSDNLRAIVVLLLIYYRKNTDFFFILRQFRDRNHLNQPSDSQLGILDARQDFEDKLSSIIARGSRRGEFIPCDPEQVARILVEAIGVYTIAFLRKEEMRSAREMADEIFRLFMHGILHR